MAGECETLRILAENHLPPPGSLYLSVLKHTSPGRSPPSHSGGSRQFWLGGQWGVLVISRGGLMKTNKKIQLTRLITAYYCYLTTKTTQHINY